MKKEEIIVVTGGSRGIGRAVAERFVAEGYDVVVSARNVAAITEPGLLPVAADLATRAGVDTLAQYVATLGRPVAALVNNAGVFLPGAIHQEEAGTFETLMNTNIASAYHLTRALLPAMMARRAGHIFMMCSTASIMPYVNGGSYCISKFALLGMSRVLREELKPHDVRVTAILPGATFTDSWASSGLPPERFMRPQDVAEAIWTAFSLPVGTVIEELLLRPQLGDI